MTAIQTLHKVVDLAVKRRDEALGVLAESKPRGVECFTPGQGVALTPGKVLAASRKVLAPWRSMSLRVAMATDAGVSRTLKPNRDAMPLDWSKAKPGSAACSPSMVVGANSRAQAQTGRQPNRPANRGKCFMVES